MASSSEDLRDNRKIKFISKHRHEKEQLQQQVSSSAGSSGDDDNDDFEGGTSPLQNNVINHTSSGSNQLAYPNTKSKKKRAVWEVIEGYRDSNLKVNKPHNHEGILLKRRNWPMKGWHKRYFILADGILSYGKSKADLTKNKLHGTINAYLSIVSYINSSRRILIDSSTQSSAFVCHLKARSQNDFDSWIDHLKQHRLYYQYKYTQQITPQSSNNRSQSFAVVNSNSMAINAIQPAGIQNQNQPPSINNSENNSSNLNQPSNTDSTIKTIKKTNVVDDSLIDNQFKQVEDGLMNLSRVLSSLYLTSLTNSLSSSTVSNQSNQQQQQQPVQQPQQQSSSKFLFARKLLHDKPKSADYLQVATNATKIHVSKSNPNLINNEIQINDLNTNGSINSIGNGNIPAIITSMTNNINIANTNGNNNVNGNQNTFQNITNTPNMKTSTSHSRNLSNVQRMKVFLK
jgi:hypothetical protein